MPEAMHIRAESVGEDGWGVGQHEGREVRVFDLLPGEEARVEAQHRSRQKPVTWARIVERVGAPSPVRTLPRCPGYGECGGCAWQHMSLEAQHAQKRRRVENALLDSFGSAPDFEGPVASERAYGYRNKGKYVFGIEAGGVVLGAYRPRTHSIVSTVGCQIVEPVIDVLAERVRVEVEERGLPIYIEKRSERGLRYTIIRANGQGQALVALVCTSDTDETALLELAEALIREPQVCGVIRCDNDLRSGALLANQERVLCGVPLTEDIAGVQIELGAQAFYQLNRAQAARAYQDIAGAIGAPGSGSVVELYSGVGGIAFTLARAGHQVLGVERDAAAVAIAQEGAARAGLGDRLQFRCAEAEAIERELFADAQAVVVDPPRKGLGSSVLALLRETRPACIAYLSCGPESLAGDLAQLLEVGYRIELARLYDFMPGTAQIETLVVLRR